MGRGVTGIARHEYIIASCAYANIYNYLRLRANVMDILINGMYI